MEDLKIDDIEGYVDDHSIMFKKVAQPRADDGTTGKKKEVKQKLQRRMLNNSSSFLTTLISVLLFVLI